MSTFEFATAQRIIFGAGKVKQAGGIAAELGRRALVVTGSRPARAQILLEVLQASGIACETLPAANEPTVSLVQHGLERAQQAGCDVVIGFGGGSAIDTGKAIAALAANPGEILDYLEVIGRGQPIKNAPLPFIAIPTTAGSGAEVTRNAVLASPEYKVKVSLRSPMMLPRVAIVDPALTYDLPPMVTAATGMDALAQLIEPYVSARANPMTDALCREGIVRAARSLQCAYENGKDEAAREDMALASLMGGLALANSGLGAVHGFASPIGGMFPAPHGAVCARLLPLVWETNIAALQARAPDSAVLRRYGEVARWLTGRDDAQVADGVRWLNELQTALHIEPFARYGMRAADVPDVVQKAAVASSMQANPIKLTTDELTSILQAAL